MIKDQHKPVKILRTKNLAAEWMKKHSMLVFIIVLLFMSVLYQYHIIAFSPPQSVHRWRQTDCTSVTLNYYQHGMKFFKPEVHSLVSDDYTSGYSAGEAPLLYYGMAAIYKLLGPDDTFYRIFNTLFFLLGIFILFRISFFFLKDYIIAAFTALLIFTSPVSVYYGCNYLPDSTALALVFLGWWQFLKHTSTKHYNRYLLSVLFFTLAGLLKVTMTINLVALSGFIIWQHLYRSGSATIQPGLKRLKIYLPITLGLSLITCWYLYAISYNRAHNSGTFLTGIRPWWDVNTGERQNLTRFIIDNNLTLYFSQAVYYFLGACLLLAVLFRRKIPSGLAIITFLLITGGFVYVNLWYSQFQYHDYYFITLLTPLAFLIIAGMIVLKNRYEKVFHSRIFRLALLAFLTVNVFHARHEVNLRYYGWKREAPVYEEYFTIRPYLKSIGIQPADRVISIPDVTSCYTLYMMNQQGNNIASIDSTTVDQINKYIRLGARYLFVNDTAILRNPALKDFLKVKAGQSGNVHIFRLDSMINLGLRFTSL